MTQLLGSLIHNNNLYIPLMSLDTARALVAQELERLKQLITDNINSNINLVNDLSHHIFKSGGKRLRPLILLLVGKACNKINHNHILSAAAVEYFHTATLLHDDVLDESILRRGQETANSLWGDKTSILVGDVLLTQSVDFMTQTNEMPLLNVLINAAHEITCGEVKQLANKNSTILSLSEYFDVICSKTAKLFSAATKIGAMSSGMPEQIVNHMESYGLHLGNAFQIVDDLLDYKASEAILGKKPGDDLREGKITLPLIFAQSSATKAEKRLIEQALLNDSNKHFEDILEIMHKYGIFEQTIQLAQKETHFAEQALENLEESEAKKALVDLLEFTLSRSY